MQDSDLQTVVPQKTQRPPMRPKRPLFGMRIPPALLAAAVLALMALATLICFASNPNFLPNINPFAGDSPFKR